MKMIVIMIGISLFIALTAGADAQQDDFPDLAGPYLGQKPPGITPEIFAPGIVSREGIFEHSTAYITPDLTGIFWIADSASARNRKLMCVELLEGLWTSPRDAAICKHYSNSNLSFSADGNRLYFSSRMPTGSSKTGELKDSDIWYVEKTRGVWGEPVNTGPPVNTDRTEALGIVLKNGTIYFSDYHDIYRSGYENGGNLESEKLSSPINTDEFDLAPFVAEDESFMIFESSRSGGFGGTDLYISFKDDSDKWLEPVNLGSEVNTGGHERSPYISPDGKYLFFWRVTDGSDIFWVDARIIEDFRLKR